MAAEVATKELNFAPSARRQKGISASMERIEVPPNNGNQFSPGQVIDIKLPSGMAKGHFLDFQNSYVKLSITATNTTANTQAIHLARNGIYNVIQKLEILSASSTLSVIENYHQLANIFLDSECSTAFKEGLGGVQYGMTSGIDPPGGFTGTLNDLTGALNNGTVAADAVTNTAITLTSGALTVTDNRASSGRGVKLTSDTNAQAKTTTFCFPLLLSSLFSNTKMLPCFHNDNIVIRLHLASLEDGFVSTDTVAANAVTFNPVSMICQIVKLDPMAMQLVEQANGGVYTMILDDWRNGRDSVIATESHSNTNLGFSHQSLSRVIFSYHPAIGRDGDTNGTRASRKVQQYSFQLNGKHYPSQRIKCSYEDNNENVSEVIAEIRASTRQAGDFGQPNDISLADFKLDNVDGIATIGKAFYEVDLEGLRASDQDSIYSGLYTVGGSTSLDVNYSGNGSADTTLNVWGQYQGALTLDTRPEGMNIFTYSV